MFHDRNKFSAFSLFEMLLVMIVAGIIALSAIKYAQQTKKDRVADILSNKMYFFSQAVRGFVSDNPSIKNGTYVCPTGLPDSTCSKSHSTYTFTGVTWITTLKDPATNEPLYLAPDFSFNDMEPLELQFDGKIGDQAVIVTTDGNNITVGYGMLYDMRDPANPQPQTAIAGEAADLATHLYDPQIGPSSFSYVGGLQADGNLMPIQATLGTGAAGDVYLRLDGSSAMRGDVTFDPNAVSKNISGVDKATFTGGGEFRGIYNRTRVGVSASATEKRGNLNYGPDDNICYLLKNQMRVADGYCEVYLHGDLYRLRAKHAECIAECVRFREYVPENGQANPTPDAPISTLSPQTQRLNDWGEE